MTLQSSCTCQPRGFIVGKVHGGFSGWLYLPDKPTAATALGTLWLGLRLVVFPPPKDHFDEMYKLVFHHSLESIEPISADDPIGRDGPMIIVVEAAKQDLGRDAAFVATASAPAVVVTGRLAARTGHWLFDRPKLNGCEPRLALISPSKNRPSYSANRSSRSDG